MEDERDQEEFKHVCKLCNKRYPSGKSLGGHMRSHVIANSNKNKPISKIKDPTFDAVLDDDDDDDDGFSDERDKGHSGYVLRENPKKSWRLVDSSFNKGKQQQQQQESVCKQCGKVFQSLKALCGHMSSHSEKERNFIKQDYDNSWSSESHSFNNNNNKSNKRRSSCLSSKCRSLTAVESHRGGGGSSSNNSEIDQQEQEDVAMCLMMLSRDSSGHKISTCFNFTTESSDNNSVILEGRSSSNHVRFGKGKLVNLMMNKNNTKQVGALDQEMDNSDSGYFENGAKELQSDESVDGSVRNLGFNKPKVDIGSGLLDSFDDENSSKKIKQDYYYYNNSNNNNNNPLKVSKFECFICNKTFKTHQALGGHIMSHRKNDANYLDSPKIQSCNAKTLINEAKKGSGSKRVKGHKCPYCPKVFKSGQALGGHKRSHMIGGGASLDKRIPLPPEPEHKQPVIDLNLPAPLEEEASGNFAW